MAPSWFAAPNTYLEVDTKEDLTLLRSIVRHFVDRGQEHFGLAEILDLLRGQPNLQKGNVGVERRWKKLREEKND